MSTLNRRSFLTFGSGAAAFAALPLAGCGGGSDESFPPVAAPAKGPMAVAKNGGKFEALGNAHSLLITDASGHQKTVGGVGFAQGKLNYPSGVAVLDGLAYVVETGNHRVQVFDTAGNSVATMGEGLLFYPGGIAAGTSEVFVADSRNKRIVAFSAAGQVTRILGAGVLSAPRGLAVVADGLLVADAGLRKVLKLGFDGSAMALGTDWVLPWDVATDGENAYVADASRSELVVTTLGGTFAGTIALSAAPSNVWYRSGTLFVA